MTVVKTSLKALIRAAPLLKLYKTKDDVLSYATQQPMWQRHTGASSKQDPRALCVIQCCSPLSWCHGPLLSKGEGLICFSVLPASFSLDPKQMVFALSCGRAGPFWWLIQSVKPSEATWGVPALAQDKQWKHLLPGCPFVCNRGQAGYV